VEIWNSIPGNAPVKKFENPNKAVARIWKAIQTLADTARSVPTKSARRAKKGRAGGDRAEKDRSNKKAEVIALMRRGKGATLGEIMKETAWQAHTVRGFVSILASKGGYKIESSKNADGEGTSALAANRPRSQGLMSLRSENTVHFDRRIWLAVPTPFLRRR
jgi:Protein of unknown function (DUF3489)